jgi:hypothetical protein
MGWEGIDNNDHTMKNVDRSNNSSTLSKMRGSLSITPALPTTPMGRASSSKERYGCTDARGEVGGEGGRWLHDDR